MNRQKIANIIDRQSHTDWICTAYDWFMVLAILVSLLPLMFMKSYKAFWYTEISSTLVFIIDYLQRWGRLTLGTTIARRRSLLIRFPLWQS